MASLFHKDVSLGHLILSWSFSSLDYISPPFLSAYTSQSMNPAGDPRIPRVPRTHRAAPPAVTTLLRGWPLLIQGDCMVISSQLYQPRALLFLPASEILSWQRCQKNCFFELFSNFDAITRDSEICAASNSSLVSFSNLFTGQNRVLRFRLNPKKMSTWIFTFWRKARLLSLSFSLAFFFFFFLLFSEKLISKLAPAGAPALSLRLGLSPPGSCSMTNALQKYLWT